MRAVCAQHWQAVWFLLRVMNESTKNVEAGASGNIKFWEQGAINMRYLVAVAALCKWGRRSHICPIKWRIGAAMKRVN